MTIRARSASDGSDRRREASGESDPALALGALIERMFAIVRS